MIVVLRADHSDAQRQQLVADLQQRGLAVDVSRSAGHTILGVTGDDLALRELALESLPAVERVVPIRRPYRLVGRDLQPEDTRVQVGGTVFGGAALQIIAGPCSVEDRELLLETALAVKEAGATLLRGGAYKPRSSPYAFQGLGERGLELLAEARQVSGLPVVTEVTDPRDVDAVARSADMLQVGTRNMQNYRLLQEVGAQPRPVLLKRGQAATVAEWLLSAEYVAVAGNRQIVLCERGIRTFETATRSTLDLSSVPLLKRQSHLPVAVDPSHAAGRYDLVEPLARAAVAAGADGLLIEVHVRPEQALCDGNQSLRPERFARLVESVAAVAGAVGRDLAPRSRAP